MWAESRRKKKKNVQVKFPVSFTFVRCFHANSRVGRRETVCKQCVETFAFIYPDFELSTVHSTTLPSTVIF